MATAWPTAADVQNLLRLVSGSGADPGETQLVTQDLAAAIAWATRRCDPQFTSPGAPAFLPDDLFMAAALEAARLYRRRDSVDGTIGWGDMGIVRVGPKDPDIETLISGYLALPVG
jgi:hypothetical protein